MFSRKNSTLYFKLLNRPPTCHMGKSHMQTNVLLCFSTNAWGTYSGVQSSGAKSEILGATWSLLKPHWVFWPRARHCNDVGIVLFHDRLRSIEIVQDCNSRRPQQIVMTLWYLRFLLHYRERNTSHGLSRRVAGILTKWMGVPTVLFSTPRDSSCPLDNMNYTVVHLMRFGGKLRAMTLLTLAARWMTWVGLYFSKMALVASMSRRSPSLLLRKIYSSFSIACVNTSTPQTTTAGHLATSCWSLHGLTGSWKSNCFCPISKAKLHEGAMRTWSRPAYNPCTPLTRNRLNFNVYMWSSHSRNCGRMPHKRTRRLPLRNSRVLLVPTNPPSPFSNHVNTTDWFFVDMLNNWFHCVLACHHDSHRSIQLMYVRVYRTSPDVVQYISIKYVL